MISIIFNGEPLEVGSESAVTDVLREAGMDPSKGGIAVAVDDAVVPRSQWEVTRLVAGANVEVITAFQGG